MPSKETVLVSANKDKYNGGEVRHLINSITHIETQKDGNTKKPQYIKRGDALRSLCGTKKRPIIVVKVLKDIIIGIPLSTTEDGLNLMPYSSRFYGQGYFSNSFVVLNKENAMYNYDGQFDNEKQLRKAVRHLKQFINENI